MAMKMLNLLNISSKLISRQASIWSLILTPFKGKVSLQLASATDLIPDPTR